jgi:transcriptional regulator GlxA family with amidase domain
MRRRESSGVFSTAEPRRVVCVATPGSAAIDLIGALDLLTITNTQLGTMGRGPGYVVEVVAAAPGVVTSWPGLELVASRPFASVIGEIDTLILGAFDEPGIARRDRRLIAWLRRTAPRTRRLVALCSGAFLLAEAGLLDGRRATTHWTFCAELARRYPRVTLEPEPIYVHDRGVYTSAGSTASIDLLLGLVEEDFGRRVAQSVALHMVLFVKRPSGQAQMSVPLSAGLAERRVLRDLQSWIVDHLGEDLGSPALARRVAMSPRNFFRAFSHEIGLTPARFVERARVEAARQLLEDTWAGVDAIASRCGFRTAETMRAAFQRVLRVSPHAYRTRATGGDGQPGLNGRPAGGALSRRARQEASHG